MMHMQQNSTVISVRQSEQMCVCVCDSALFTAVCNAFGFYYCNVDTATERRCGID